MSDNNMEELLLRGSQIRSDIPTFVGPFEAEKLVETIRCYAVAQVGSGQWLRQHDAIERLNIQAHQSAQSRSDEYIVEALVIQERLSHLVHELLVAEAWVNKVLPLLSKHLAQHVDSVLWQPLLAQETLLCNLLEVALYHQHACAAMSEDALMELCDYCQRKLVLLHSRPVPLQPEDWKAAVHQDAKQELQDRQQESQFSAAMSALTILRYLTDHMESLPLGIMSRIVTVNDSVLILVPLLEKKPWQRGVKEGLQQFEDGAWVQSGDSLKLTKQPAQVWLAIYNILTGVESRSKALASSTCCSAALRLRPLLTDILMDQLPVLKDLRRVLDELMIGCTGPAREPTGGCLIIEQVPIMREAILRGADWVAIAHTQKEGALGSQAAEQTELRRRNLLSSLDALCAMEPDQQARERRIAEASGQTVSISVWCTLQNGVLEPWSDFKLVVDTGKPEEEISVKGSDGDKQDCVKGKRSRLRAIGVEYAKPLPAEGKVAVVYGKHSTECRVSLPVGNTKTSSAGELASHGWLTVGNLAADGIALQLKLKRVAKPQVRDKDMGAWLCYHPTGGAITVLCKEGSKTQGPTREQPLRF